MRAVSSDPYAAQALETSRDAVRPSQETRPQYAPLMHDPIDLARAAAARREQRAMRRRSH